ncbi:TAXI family TRAP transporter solute-binding subunit [Tepidicaulis sp.]|uniref:TAXI family TRAP transporter solute-binding subunit n=1 Tax=Tepidicaulis sp. TaxID=1920809 RepID=UPI003B5B33A7
MARLAALFMGIIALVAGAAGAGAQERQYVTIGTGGVTGVYYPAGGAICALTRKTREEHNIRCSVESTGGSIFNLNALRQGELQLGVAQSDWQYHAYKGTSQFTDAGPMENLRSVFSLHPEPFTVLARADAGISSFEDLKGKRVNIGNPGSGQRATMEVLMKAYGWELSDFLLASELVSTEQSMALCDNKVDAIVFAVGHPSGSIQEATTTCETRLINVNGPKVEKLIEENSFYAPATIPGGLYQGNSEDVQTFGVAATLVSTADVEADVVYYLTSSVFENFDDFRKLHPAFQALTKEGMAKHALTAPLHEGAARYFKEAGLIE